MDRNSDVKWKIVATYVALRKESVDRNTAFLAARVSSLAVALRKESVDRNYSTIVTFQHPSGLSLSARRAWIEMSQVRPMMVTSSRRSPQGERG